MSETKKDNAVEETIEELLEDPDSPAHSDTGRPPQTIENEPSGNEPRGR